MRLTTELLVNNFSLATRASVTGDLERQKRQIETDMSFAKKGFLCHKDTLETPVTMDLKQVYQVFESDFYSSDAMQVPTCIAENLSYIGQETGMHKILLHLVLSDIPTFIGEPSVEGYVSRIEYLFLMKTARDATQDYIAHEFYVGSVLNQLRNTIPTFMYVYSLFQCSPPYTSARGDKMITWCPMSSGHPYDNREQVSYMLIENVTPSDSFASVVSRPGMTTVQLFSYLFQVFQALLLSRRQFDFSHNDLHSGNILLRKIPKYNKIAVPYGSSFLLTDRISTIIDYGRARVKNGNYVSSYHVGRRFGIDPDKSAMFSDVYKIICSLIQARGFRMSRDPIRDKLQLLLSFFIRTGIPSTINPQDYKNLKALVPDVFDKDEYLENLINQQSRIWFTLTDIPQTQGETLDTFFIFFLAAFEKEFSVSIISDRQQLNKKGYKILELEDTKLSYARILKDILYKGDQLNTVEKFFYASQLFVEQFPQLKTEDMLASLGPKVNVPTSSIETIVHNIISLNNRIKSTKLNFRYPYEDVSSVLRDYVKFESLAVPYTMFSLYYPSRYPKLTSDQVATMRQSIKEFINIIKDQVVRLYDQNKNDNNGQRLSSLIRSF